MRGPIPNRSDERRRRNEPEIPIDTVVPSEHPEFDINDHPTPPPANENWEPMVIQLYEAIAHSHSVVYMTEADWALAYIHSDQLDRELKPQFVGMTVEVDGSTKPNLQKVPMKGGSLTAHLKFWGSVGVTEGERRRLRIEIARTAAKATPLASVTDIASTRAEALGA